MPIVRQVALDNVPLRNGPSSQKFSEEPMFIFFLQWELIIIIQIKWLILLLLDHGILYKPPKWPVLYDKCIRKSMVVCNLYGPVTLSEVYIYGYVLGWKRFWDLMIVYREHLKYSSYWMAKLSSILCGKIRLTSLYWISFKMQWQDKTANTTNTKICVKIMLTSPEILIY